MTELDRLLRRIADGDTSPALVGRARALLKADVRLPEDLREVGLDDEDPDIAASALLGVLGLDDGLFGGLLGEALRSEAELPWQAPAAPVSADEHEITADMLHAQEAAGLPPVAEAVRALAGEVSLALPVLRAIGVQVIDVGEAVAALAGEIDVADDVATRLGVLPAPLGTAVRTEAGEAEVAADIVAPLGELVFPIAAAVRSEAGQIDLADRFDPGLVPVADAVRAEAGGVDLADDILARLQGVADAVRSEAGDIDIADAVAPLGLEIAAAIRAEAGEIDIADAIAPLTVDVAAAVRAEAGDIDIADGFAPTEQVADAVRSEAGEVDVWAGIGGAFSEGWVSGLLDHELGAGAHRIAARRLMTDPTAGAELAAFADQGRTLRAAVREEAGETPYIWAEVAGRIGIEAPEEVPGYDGSLVAESVRAEAGPVRIAQGVMARIARPTSVAPAPLDTPAPANRPQTWQLLAMVSAAAVVMLVLVGRFGAPVATFFDSEPATLAAQPLDFAGAGEVNVEQLSYDADVDVIVTLPDETGDRPLIIRIEEEA